MKVDASKNVIQRKSSYKVKIQKMKFINVRVTNLGKRVVLKVCKYKESMSVFIFVCVCVCTRVLGR